MGRGRYGGDNMEIKKFVKSHLTLYNFLVFLWFEFRYKIPRKILGKNFDVKETKRKFKKIFGRNIDLNNPQTLNEKIQWLKLNVHDDFHTLAADKYRAREYWKQFGEEGLIPLLYMTYDWKDIKPENLPDEPCIVKCNSGSGRYMIIRDKANVNYKKLRKQCHLWLRTNYYYTSQEWQYKNIKPCIIVEKLLLDKNGHIPNDYKLHYINGELQFIYCSIDREGENYRNIYSPEWKRIDMEWVAPNSHKGGLVGKEIPQPSSFERMKEIADEIAKNFKYVRVDFYDVDGKLYYGEITLHHGGGFDTFEPQEFDLIYGKKLILH